MKRAKKITGFLLSERIIQCHPEAMGQFVNKLTSFQAEPQVAWHVSKLV
jgi:hypothetical protein